MSLFAQVDFVEFIKRQAGVAHIDLPSLAASEMFREAVLDFKLSVAYLAAVTESVERQISAHSMDLRLVAGSWQMPAAIKLAAYCGDLPSDDPRYLNVGSADKCDISSWQRARRMLYNDFDVNKSKYIGHDISYSTIKNRDEGEFVIHWIRAFPTLVCNLMSDPQFIAGLRKMSQGGVDNAVDTALDAADEISIETPCLTSDTRLRLVLELSRLWEVGLLQHVA